MAVLTRGTYVSVGALGGMATRAYDLFQWAELKAIAQKRGEDFVVQGVDGATHVDRVRGSLRAICKGRVDGRYDPDGAAQTWTTGIYTNWDLVAALADVVGQQTVQLYVDSTLHASGSAVVDLSTPRRASGDAPWVWEFDMYFQFTTDSLTAA